MRLHVEGIGLGFEQFLLACQLVADRYYLLATGSRLVPWVEGSRSTSRPYYVGFLDYVGLLESVRQVELVLGLGWHRVLLFHGQATNSIHCLHRLQVATLVVVFLGADRATPDLLPYSPDVYVFATSELTPSHVS